MAILKLSRESWTRFPFLNRGQGGFKKEIDKSAGHLKIREMERSKEELARTLGWDELANKCHENTTGDKIIVDTGKKLVEIQADKLDLKGVRAGDKVEFQLDDKVDPGGAARIKGRVLVAIDGADPTEAQLDAAHQASLKEARDIRRPLDAKDPVSDLVIRRAQLFQEFRNGTLDQDSLRETWEALRQEAVNRIVDGKGSVFEKQAALQQLLDMGAFTPQEAEKLGIQVVATGFGAQPEGLPT